MNIPIEIIKYIITINGDLSVACKLKFYDCAENIIIEYSKEATDNMLVSAAKNGQLEVLKWFHKRRHLTDTINMKHITFFTISYGHLEVLKWFVFGDIFKLSQRNLADAIASGHIHIVEWMFENSNLTYDDISVDFGLDFYVLLGEISMFEYIYKKFNKCNCSLWTVVNASRNGYLHIIEWIHKYATFEYDEELIEMSKQYAKKNKNDEIYEYICREFEGKLK